MTDEEREKKEVKIGIGICTFKREKYVERNMKVLKENLLNNENALSYGHLSVCISDNGGTLVREKIEDEYIRIVKKTLVEWVDLPERCSNICEMIVLHMFY